MAGVMLIGKILFFTGMGIFAMAVLFNAIFVLDRNRQKQKIEKKMREKY